MIRTGNASTTAPRVPNAINVGVIVIGPKANPTMPPTVNKLIVVAWREPLRYLTRRAASGWNAEIPKPLIAIAAKINPYPGAMPDAATPSPAKLSPTGISHGDDRRSASIPNSGCTIDEESVCASTRPAAAAYD